MKYFIGILMIIAGFIMVWKTDFMMKTFGRVAWAEQHLGTTWTFYKILGVLIILLAFLIMGGDMLNILDYIFGKK